MQRFLPYSRQAITQDDMDAVRAVLQSDFLTTGPKVTEFEKLLQQNMQVKHALVVNSGTAALHLAWQALGLPKGAKVIVPAVTFLSAASMALLAGFDELIFADCDPETGLMDADCIARAAGDDTSIKAICVVHLNGQSADMPAIKQLADGRGWKIIEDGCHMLGGQQKIASDKYLPMGSCYFSDITVFSLHAVKNITTGEGGIITCNDDMMAQNMRDWRTHGMVRDGHRLQNLQNADDALWYHEMDALGMNYRMSDIQAALGISQFKKLPQFIDKRVQLFALYQQLIGEMTGTDNIISMLKTEADTGIAAWHLAVVLIDFSKLTLNRGQLMRQLRDKQIGTQLHYMPIYQHGFFRALYPNFTPLAGAEQYAASALSIPLFYDMTADEVHYVVQHLQEILTAHIK